MKMKEKNITARVSTDQIDYLKEKGITPYAFASQAFQSAILVEQNFRVPAEEIVSRMAELNYVVRTMAKVAKTLTRQELTAIVDALNGTMVTTDILFVPGWLLIQMEDAETYDATISRHGADPAILLPKIKAMDGVQMYAIYAIVREFWNSPAEKQDLNRFLDRFAMSKDDADME
jgi:hypothetical protein